MSRRATLLGIGAAAMTGLSSRLLGAPLQSIAGERQMLFGAAARAAYLRDPALREILVREVGTVTAEVEMKWSHVEPEPGTFDFLDADLVANFAQAHQKRLHGHTLLWHRSVPQWAGDAWRDKPDWRTVETFIRTMMTRYHGVESWDVVNEPIDISDQSDGLRRSAYLEAFGPDYIARAFRTARKHAPTALLCLNEFGIEYDIPEHRQKRDSLLRLLRQLRDAKAPVGAVGIQAHLDLAHQPNFVPDVFAAFLNELGSMGLQIRISELDVKEAETELPIEERDQRASDAVSQFLEVALANKAVGSVTCWGLSDRYSWLDEEGGNRGLPFDAQMRAKPMRQAIATALYRR